MNEQDDNPNETPSLQTHGRPIVTKKLGEHRSRKVRVGDARLREAIIAFRGNLSEVARHVKLSRMQVNNRLKQCPELQTICNEVRDKRETGLTGRPRQPDKQRVSDDQIAEALRRYSVCVKGAYSLPARELGISTQALRQRVEESESLQWVIQSIREEMLSEAVITWRAMARGVKVMDRSPTWSAVNKILEVFGGLVTRTEISGAGGGPLQFVDVTEQRRRAAVELRLHEEAAA